MNNQRWMSQNFFIFFMTWGVFLPYWTGWLVEGKGLSVSEASLIMSFGLVARGASTLFAFPLASRRWSNKTVIVLLTGGALLAALLYIPANSFTTLFAVTLIFSMFYPALLPALDSTAGILVQHGRLHYGKSRSYGSLGFIISVLILSVITGYFGDSAILWVMIIMLIAMLLMLNFTAAPEVLLVKPEKTKSNFSIRSLWNIKGFPLVLLIVVLLQGAHASYYNYGYIYLQDLGVSKYYIGMIINIGVIFEILYFAKADNVFGKWKPASLLVLSAAGSTVRWLLVAFFPNVWVFVISQSLHALSFGVAHYAFILYITQKLPKDQIPNAQGVYSALALSWSTAILTLLGGSLYEIEPGYAFLGMIICTIPALLLSLRFRARS
ncbi:MFS transporter [Bacillus massiliigorillae]|uniref:MFS transporter n=1 Tax=Bacillus massiliigorillae TaxID=1243664 RepID=UPI00039B7FF7|nr:MFS transporter [Bacillus massiliigorillae]